MEADPGVNFILEVVDLVTCIMLVFFYFVGSFYLCRTQQNVFQNTKHFKIQWLDKDEKTDVYKFDFLDHTEIECVLTNVRMERVARETYELPETEKARIELILSKALKKEKGEPYEDLVMDTEEEGSHEEGKWKIYECKLVCMSSFFGWDDTSVNLKVIWATQDILPLVPSEHTGPNQILSDRET